MDAVWNRLIRRDAIDMKGLLAFVVFWPFAAGLICFPAGRREACGAGEKRRMAAIDGEAGGSRSADGRCEAIGRNLRDGLAIAAVVLELLCAAMICFYMQRAAGASGNAAGSGGFSLELPGVCGLGLGFTLDGFRAVYLCVTAFMWLMAAVYSRDYFGGHKNVSRFILFLLWTLGAVVGVFLSADLFTTFFFFEIMSLTSYVWVAQEEDVSSLRAADTYLAVAVVGGLVMLMGLFLLQHLLGTLVIEELSAAAAACADRRALYAAGGCMLFGFGAKAGAFPLHIWLPKAHPVAPAPASALLSGALTKTGVYGILILSCQLFYQDGAWGRVILALGLATMFGGALLALFSVDLKRTLACSTMSQIGFILMGAGLLGMAGEPETAAVAGAGAFLHMVNHSLVKLVLFLAAGAVYQGVHGLDLNVVRGFGCKKPLLAGIFLTGALTLAGIPLFGGYVSKTLLHEAVLECGGGMALHAAEWIFLFSGGLTVAYMTKLFAALFVEKNQDVRLQEEYDGMRTFRKPASAFALGGSAAVLLVWGLFPHRLMESAAGLAGGFLHLDETGARAPYYDMESLMGAAISIGIGMAVYLLFVRRFLRKEREGYVDRWPKWLDLENLLYRPLLLRILPFVLGVACRAMDSLVDAVVVALRRTIYRDSPLPYERTEGNAFTVLLGRALNAFQNVGNRLWRRNTPTHRDYVHLAAVKNEEIRETNHIIQRSLSFGLLLFCIGLSLTLLYLIWW